MLNNVNIKLMNAIHYVIYFANKYKLNLSTIILNKIIICAEIDVFSIYKAPLTGAKIIKTNYGPIPDGNKIAITALKNLNKILIEKINHKTTYISLIMPDISFFSDGTLEILKFNTLYVCNNYIVKKLSYIITNNKYWKIADYGEEIPLLSFFPSISKIFTLEEFEKLHK
ncbi:MAG: hypothetical protein LBU12_07325 [Deltaproteobacteria bacterium]|jgi:hypothetical protein|nr:hypothetical protein [Deltaproteobacteria bacterium]